jgi:cell wall-associated NlpC family hydrolase
MNISGMGCHKEYNENRLDRAGAFCARGKKSSYIRENNLRQSALSPEKSVLGDHRRSFKPVEMPAFYEFLKQAVALRFTLVPNGSASIQDGSAMSYHCPESFNRERPVVHNQIPCYRMTHLLQRLGSVAVLMMIAIGLLAAAPAEAKKSGNARRSAGSAKKLSHNGSTASKKGAKNRSAKASKVKLARAERAKSEKLALAEKIKQLSTSQLVDDDVAPTFDLEAELAQAAKEEAEEDDVEVSIEQFFRARPGAIGADNMDPELIRARQIDFTLYDEADPGTAAKRSDVMQNIIDWMGTRYVFGGVGRAGIDCSAFTREVYAKSFGVELPRTANMQSHLGESIRKEDLQFGDLVFFKTASYAPITHVGIYIGEGLFANAASSKGVSLGSLDSKYWSKRYTGGKRLFTNSALAGNGTRAGNFASKVKALEPSELPH